MLQACCSLQPAEHGGPPSGRPGRPTNDPATAAGSDTAAGDRIRSCGEAGEVAGGETGGEAGEVAGEVAPLRQVTGSGAAARRCRATRRLRSGGRQRGAAGNRVRRVRTDEDEEEDEGVARVLKRRDHDLRTVRLVKLQRRGLNSQAKPSGEVPKPYCGLSLAAAPRATARFATHAALEPAVASKQRSHDPSRQKLERACHGTCRMRLRKQERFVHLSSQVAAAHTTVDLVRHMRHGNGAGSARRTSGKLDVVCRTQSCHIALPKVPK